jgi:hypothetical protein
MGRAISSLVVELPEILRLTLQRGERWEGAIQ